MVFYEFSMDFYGFLWFSMGFLWFSMGFLWISMGFLWVFNGFLWVFYGFLWFSMVFYGFSMVFYGFSMDFYGFSMVFQWFSMVFHGFSGHVYGCSMISGKFYSFFYDFCMVPPFLLSTGHFKWEFTDFASAFYEFKRLTGNVSRVFSFRMYESYQPTWSSAKWILNNRTSIDFPGLNLGQFALIVWLNFIALHHFTLIDQPEISKRIGLK